MKIGIDVDGCVYNWTMQVNKVVREVFEIEGLGEHETWDYLKDRMPPDQWEWIWSANAADYGIWDEGDPYPNAVDVINTLAQTHEVHFCTHRNPVWCSVPTSRWLQQHFRGYKGVHVLANTISKADVYAWDVFIDDKPDTVRELRNRQIKTLCPDRLWNKEVHDRFASWLDVPELI